MRLSEICRILLNQAVDVPLAERARRRGMDKVIGATMAGRVSPEDASTAADALIVSEKRIFLKALTVPGQEN